MRKSHLFIALLVLTNTILSAQTKGTIESQIDAMFSKYNSSTPGVAVSVVKDGKIILKKGYGMATLEYDIPITPSTVFHVASVSKQFTAFAIYLLEQQGKISLDDDIRKYLPEVPVFEKPITIRHLCSHTSGLRDQWALMTLAGWRMDDVITTDQILKLVNSQKALNSTPGTQFKYNNTGFTLLAEIIKRVSGQTFAAYTKRYIFEPLGMTNSQFYDDNDRVVKNRAYSYSEENDIYKKKNLNYSTVGPTSLMTTVEDLSKWVLNFENPIVGDRELIKKFNEVSLLDNGEPVLYTVVEGEKIYHAKGQFFRNYRGLDLFNHTGHDAGFQTYIARFPDKHLSVIVLSNDDSFRSLKSGLDIAELYLKDDLKKKNVAKATVQNEKAKPSDNLNTNLKDFEGTFYCNEITATYDLKIENGKLIISHKRLSDTPLTLIDKDTFSGKIEFAVEIAFIRDNSKSITGFKVSNFGVDNLKFDKVK